MISKWHLRLQQLGSKVWVRAVLFAVLGVVAALLAVKIDQFLPLNLPTKVGADAIHDILKILAASMLAVTTFSLSVMVSSLAAATSSVTPRATRLLIEDATTQNVLAVFLGTFLYSIVGIVALSTGYYSDRGRFILFVISVGVIGIVVLTMIRWIDHLTRLGRVGETSSRVEQAAGAAIQARAKTPYLGGRRILPALDERIRMGRHIYPKVTGYVTYVDTSALQHIAKSLGTEICLASPPGTFVYRARPLATLLRPENEAGPIEESELDRQLERLYNAFDIEAERTFRQDPRFGMAVLAEIASRALSTAVNDAGTAIDVLGRGVRLLEAWVDPQDEEGEATCDRVYVPAITQLEMFEDFFTPIARDGAALVEVQIRVQKSLLALAEMGSDEAKAAALKVSRVALQRADNAIVLQEDMDRIRDAARPLQSLTLTGPEQTIPLTA